MALLKVFNHTLMITGFVFVMMLVVEYINVQTRGVWQQKVFRNKWGQYILAAFLGAIPGCLGAFTVVAMFSHRILSIGAVVAAMIATSGDESFVMFAMIPDKAFFLTILLFAIGIAAGGLTDLLLKDGGKHTTYACDNLNLHENDQCLCFPKGQILQQWKERSPFRSTLVVVLGLFILAVVIGQVGPGEWNWARISILLVSFVALFIAATVPDHFLEEHLWEHVAKRHVPRLFLWTFGALLAIYVLIDNLHLDSIIQENLWAVLGIALFVGLIPESGPHLIFLTLFIKGTIPFSILIANSIVQDGHGMLPMLAHSRHTFTVVKVINLTVGFSAGAIGLLLG
jgi:hypothetical protein